MTLEVDLLGQPALDHRRACKLQVALHEPRQQQHDRARGEREHEDPLVILRPQVAPGQRRGLVEGRQPQLAHELLDHRVVGRDGEARDARGAGGGVILGQRQHERGDLAHDALVGVGKRDQRPFGKKRLERW